LLGVQVDEFQRSFNPETHFPGVQELWKRCDAAGDIYKKSYEGLYCVGCERFYKESELIDGLCPDHRVAPEVVKEENYFFRLSKYQEQIRSLITSDTVHVVPEKIKNEMLAFIDRGLEDFSVSRSLERARGVGVPVPGDENQVMYVWFDALSIYMTGIGYGLDEAKYQAYWPADIHVIGKDIVRFHAIYWIAMLLSGKLALPKKIMVHGHIASGGQKMSKSIGNVIDPYEVVDRYGVDFTRYYLLSEIPTLDDGDFTYSRADELYLSDFANGLGNLISRVATLCYKSEGSFEVREYVVDPAVSDAIKNLDLRLGIQHVWSKVRDLNKKISDAEPWKLPVHELSEFLLPVVEEVRSLSIDLAPFLPHLSQQLQSHFMQNHIGKIEPLFPRLQPKE
jgi:methionyl-tRNA synthetase